MTYSPSIQGGQYVEPAQFGVGSSGAGSQIVTQSIYDLHPTDLTQLFERNKGGVGWRMLVKMMGMSRAVSAPTTGHYEVGRETSYLVVGAIVTPSTGAGTNVVVSLDATSMYTFTDDAGNAQTGSFPRVNDVLRTKGAAGTAISAQVVAKDTTVNPHRVTLRPLVATQDLVGLLVAGEKYWIQYSLFGEATDIPTGLQPQIIKYTNTFAMIKEAAISSGSNLATRPYFDPLPGQPGTLFLRNTEEMSQRYEERCDNALLFGEQADNLTVTPTELGYTVPVSGTEGMITYLENYAFIDTVIAGTQQIQNFDDISRLLTFERVISNDYLVLQGFNSYQTYENVFADYASKYESTDFIIKSETSEGMEDIKINVGAYGIRKSGFKYMFKQMNAFNDGYGGALSGYPYPDYSVFVPVTYIKDKTTGTSMPTCGYEYRGLNNYSRENLFVTTDGTGWNGSLNTTTVDIHKVGLIGEIASHCTSPNNCVVQLPA